MGASMRPGQRFEARSLDETRALQNNKRHHCLYHVALPERIACGRALSNAPILVGTTGVALRASSTTSSPALGCRTHASSLAHAPQTSLLGMVPSRRHAPSPAHRLLL